MFNVTLEKLQCTCISPDNPPLNTHGSGSGLNQSVVCVKSV